MSFDNTILAAIIGFIGSIIGGAITLLGVRITLQKQDEDHFMSTFMRKMIAIERVKDILEEFREYDCPENEGEELWQIVLAKADFFAEAERRINYEIGGITAYELLEYTSFLSYSSTLEFEKWLNTDFWPRISGRDHILEQQLSKIISAIDIIIDRIDKEKTLLKNKYKKIIKKRGL
ncbi:hypothetical protein DNHGIG_14970 [Collibacillus ludicampi]|uniref:DUF4760 domain-containing protein n=1 Tax=Collibacillus ludicampi TaxID=2771369 RepID=A0AAV4LE55_9BACL|nr:hypothetical protein [Collibacillus ludicampi]GIM45948.1 hypothetical protein DNHGIG_14970 [Collibacillus ludicampi]